MKLLVKKQQETYKNENSVISVKKNFKTNI